MKKKIQKIVAVYLALNLLFEIVSPTVAMALTNGPSQPEMESFEPIGTTEMVDPFTGDFNYNIPLLTVPGPNGGYPVNLAYHAGIGMEQEASWTGLGWNVNAGEVNRQMRGLPDDFAGGSDFITKQMFMKENITASLGGNFGMELAGADFTKGFSLGLSASVQLIWNSYKGIGIGIGNGISVKSKGKSGSFGGGLSSNYNSTTGETTLSPSLSYSSKQDFSEKKYGLSFSYGSVQGAKGLSFSYSKTEKDARVATHSDKKTGAQSQRLEDKNKNHAAGISFSSSSYVPHSEMPQSGFTISTAFSYGADSYFINPNIGVSAMYTQNGIATNSIDLAAYGYMYSQDRNITQKLSVMDFNREKDAELTKDIPAMPMPVFTNDIYFVKGQGVGGAFRPYRSDIGVLHDPEITGKNLGAEVTVEVGVGNTVKVGTDMTLSYSKSYSGPWRDADTWNDLKSTYLFKGNQTNEPLYEPFYFRNAADMTANFDESKSSLQTYSSTLPIDLGFGISLTDLANPSVSEVEQPLAEVKVTKGGLGVERMTSRASRSQVMSYRTNAQLAAAPSVYSDNTKYNLNSFPRGGGATTISHSAHPQHIGEISVVNADGNRYIYGIPAYNNSSIEVSFSVACSTAVAPTNNIVTNDRTVDYSTTDASSGNIKNADHFFTSKTLPPYAHTYLLTAIISPDYIDLTGDGPTDDDYGYFVKFNYSKLTTDYNWRSPFLQANFIDGSHDIATDDKAGYTYGSRETWYLNSIETKTHVAEFSVSARKDGFGAAQINNGIAGGGAILGSTALQKLDKIDLYSKSDPNYLTTPTPIKTVHFDYTYDLCGSVENSASGTVGNYYSGIDRNANRGKLTLKKVWFSYLNNMKGLVSPYEFNYDERTITGGVVGAIDPVTNPPFSSMQMDRWGNYKSAFNQENPYVDQNSNSGSEVTRNNNSGVWCLKSVKLPSGGKIVVQYESDDYAYVQDKEAMQMSKIMGVGSIGGTSIASDDLVVYFELENQGISTDADVYPYVKGITDIYFKTFQRFKKYYVGADFAYDYVTGYAKVAGTAPGNAGYGFGIATSGITKYGYIRLAPVSVNDKNSGTMTNPFRKAGWQYLKLNRTDLLYPSTAAGTTTSALMGLANDVIGYFTSTVQLFSGYYRYCHMNGYCKELKLVFTPPETERPSFIRVNSPDKNKYGGGHRVKNIRITNSWSGLASAIPGDADYNEYGQEYVYKLADGTSSGVAEYEPLIGGDEISLRKPIRYSSDYFVVKNENLYMEEPFCESYYPAASVGYSRVIVKGITHKDNTAGTPADVTKGVEGVIMHEFYTARDFPVIVSASNMAHKKFTPDANIPFIGNVSFENHGFSQTYTVETNDMHGKVKSESTFAYGTDLTTPGAPTAIPLTKTESIYKTDAPYSSSSSNHLNNSVDVLYDDAYYKTSNLGLTKEFFIDMRERSNVSISVGCQFNVEVSFPPPVPCFSVIPGIDYSESMNKMVVGMNVINRSGVLIETKQKSDGSVAVTKNLMFDASTGKPSLTTVTNDFDAPIYTYDYAAHWAYNDGIGEAYKNIGATFTISGSGPYTITYPASPNHLNYLANGDEVVLNGASILWVTSLTSSNFHLVNRAGATYTGSGGMMYIIRSGRRNQLMNSDGKIVSLSNPVSGRTFSLFDAWNAYVLANGVNPTGANILNYPDCSSGATMVVSVSYPSNTIQFNTTNCVPIITLPATMPSGAFYLTKAGTKVILSTSPSISTSIMVGDINIPDHCMEECLRDVLHADATQLKDNWTYDFADVSNNQYLNHAVPTSTNDYVTGKKGIWRIKKSNVYQIDRIRKSPTVIATDGVYKNFTFFDWQTGINPKWTWTSQITKYSPYGFETENQDALLVYSTALYGYDNAVQTAIANNASSFEIAFDGLEDYATTYTTSYGHGHILLAGTTSISSDFSHTGNKSLKFTTGQTATFTTATQYFTPAAGQYIVSAWFKTTGTPTIGLSGGYSSAVTSYSPSIDGWRKVEVVFTATGSSIIFTFNPGSGTPNYMDDIRIQPFKSTMKTYVYDRATLKLTAELDNQNFATYYNYDQQGILVQVKKETVKGIATIKTTRSNTKRLIP